MIRKNNYHSFRIKIFDFSQTNIIPMFPFFFKVWKVGHFPTHENHWFGINDNHIIINFSSKYSDEFLGFDIPSICRLQIFNFERAMSSFILNYEIVCIFHRSHKNIQLQRLFSCIGQCLRQFNCHPWLVVELKLNITGFFCIQTCIQDYKSKMWRF